MKSLFIATHNICHMGKNPVTRRETFPDRTMRNGYESDMTEQMEQNWRAVLSSFQADVIALQEYYPWFDLAHTEATEQKVYRPFGYAVTDGGHGLALASKLPVEPEREDSFEPVSARRWQKLRLTVEGRSVALFNIHPTPKPDAIALRQQEYAAVICEMQKEKSCIVCGDFNAHDVSEFAIFAEAGYVSANTGIATCEYRNTAIRSIPCDNIVVSPDITIRRTDTFDRWLTLSDHAVLWAELAL